jgi:hypothetical protein
MAWILHVDPIPDSSGVFTRIATTLQWRYVMPLKNGKSDETVKSNIEKLVHEWESDGTIGNSHPDTKQKAVKQAVAISLKKAGRSRMQQKGAKR